MSEEIPRRDRYTVAREIEDEEEAEGEIIELDGQLYEELQVFNHVSVSENHYVNSVNGYETFEPDIAEGDMGRGPAPDYVTERVADLLWNEFSIDLEDHDIEAIDLASDEVKLA